MGDWREDIKKKFKNQVHVAETYQHTPCRDHHNIIDTFAVVCPPEKKVKCTLSTPTAVYPFPDYIRRDGDQFKGVTFTEQEKKELKELLLGNDHKTSQGKPDWNILKCDLDHDPVFVTVILDIKD